MEGEDAVGLGAECKAAMDEEQHEGGVDVDDLLYHHITHDPRDSEHSDQHHYFIPNPSSIRLCNLLQLNFALDTHLAMV